VWCDGAAVGHVTSAMFGHTLGACVALAYVEHPAGVTSALIDSARFEVEIGGERHAARASLRPLYDPTSSRVRG
jgi:4-methylaminobutanoate oxidase (formaldehyde-forming)